MVFVFQRLELSTKCSSSKDLSVLRGACLRETGAFKVVFVLEKLELSTWCSSSRDWSRARPAPAARHGSRSPLSDHAESIE